MNYKFILQPSLCAALYGTYLYGNYKLFHINVKKAKTLPKVEYLVY